jgi:GntR family transcriptional regulator / MocR family aminotransferase
MPSSPRPRAVVPRSGQRTRWAPVAEALRRALASGSRAPGELLPSTRELASTFGVHRQTIMVALDALCAEGLLRAEPRRGYRVAPAEPGPPPRPAKGRSARYGFRVVREPGPAPAALGEVKYPLHSATPDPALLPLRELRASYAHVLARHGTSALDAAAGAGNPLLVRELLGYLRRARAVLFERMLVTCGSQEGIALVARALLGPGDVVAVEDPGYFPAWQAFRAEGAEVVPVPVDSRGLRVDALERLLRRRRVRLVYVTPNHQYPTTATLSAPRRRALLELTLAHGVPILEDDYDHEYHFRGEPQPPLAASTTAPHVLYVASLSKLVAPGVRIGMLCGNGEILDVLERQRQSTVRAGDGVTQAALADWIADGGFERHVRRARRAYAERRDAALVALAKAATKVPVELTPPDGGLAVWTVWPRHAIVELARRALARGVAVLPGPLASIEANSPGMRLAYGRVSPARFAEAVSILVSEAKRM